MKGTIDTLDLQGRGLFSETDMMDAIKKHWFQYEEINCILVTDEQLKRLNDLLTRRYHRPDEFEHPEADLSFIATPYGRVSVVEFLPLQTHDR